MHAAPQTVESQESGNREINIDIEYGDLAQTLT